METFAYTLIAVFGTLLVLFFVMMGFTFKSRLAALYALIELQPRFKFFWVKWKT